MPYPFRRSCAVFAASRKGWDFDDLSLSFALYFAGITNTFSYNKRLQPINMSASSPSQTVFSIGYDFHFGNGNNGNVYGITNFKDSNRSQTFTNDPLNRLTTAQNAGTDCNARVLQNKTE